MSEDDSPAPPTLMFPSGAEWEARINDLTSRITELEDRITNSEEASALEDGRRQRLLLLDEIEQRIFMRKVTLWIAIGVMALMLLIAIFSIFYRSFPAVSAMPSSLAALLFIAPIVSMSAITVMLLIGAFRRFKDETVDEKSLLIEALKQLNSGS
ncbi:hypothetical protein ACT6QG_07880 [Xanthobacter sp. TB0136]|uniref:hypothetical protein n=1 Tax=Xanthobacter sp. TB0136 TaxID=3459177 RepID=UPI00403A0116